MVSIYSSPEDKEMMDGHGSVLFKKEGQDKIIIESWAEPSSELFRMELELDENNVPLKITEAGFYAYSGTDRDAFHYAYQYNDGKAPVFMHIYPEKRSRSVKPR